jgi:prepilin-type N-terminal cleavage/methylation domain-containing protein
MTMTALTTHKKKRTTAKKQYKGFTLIELAIIIAIVGIMSAVAITQFVDLTGNAEEALLSDYLQKLNTGVASFLAAKGYRPDGFTDFVAVDTAGLSVATGKNIVGLTDKSGTALCTIATSTITCDNAKLRTRTAVYTYSAGAITMVITTRAGAAGTT